MESLTLRPSHTVVRLGALAAVTLLVLLMLPASAPQPFVEPRPVPTSEECSEALVTAYTKDCEGCSGITADGTPADSSFRIIAADRNHWRMGTQVRLFFPEGDVRTYTVRDTGGAIKGRCRFDMLVKTEEFALKWGRKKIHFEVVRKP